MILFLFSNFILFIKLFLFILIKLILIQNLFNTIISIILVFSMLCILVKYPKKRFRKLSQLRRYKFNLLKKYCITGNIDYIYNIIIIILYCTVFTVVIFYLRLLNKEKTVDLKIYYHIIKDFVFNTPFIEVFSIVLLYILLLLVYVITMTKIVKYFKFEVIRRHIFFMNPDTNLKYFCFFHDVLCRKNLFSLQDYICKCIESLYGQLHRLLGLKKDYGSNYEELSFSEQLIICLSSPVDPDCLLIKYRRIRQFVNIITRYSHYIILLLVILYDLYYHNFVIKQMFYILPWIFFYDLYVRISIFIDDLHLPYDEKFHLLIYSNNIELFDKDNIIINGTFHDYNYFKKLYHTYVKRNFVKDRKDLFS